MTNHNSELGHSYEAHKKRHLNRLKRVEGQIRGLQRMIDDDKYCIDVLTQVAAVNRALQSFSLELLDEHMRGCVVQAAAQSTEAGEQKVKEASDAIARLVRS
jgi:CsoR family transcriptional regulator, copper-sensing transcriptional repressor